MRPLVKEATQEDMAMMKDLAEAGKMTPVIDKVYPLDQAPDAIAHVGEGHSQGKTLVTLVATK